VAGGADVLLVFGEAPKNGELDEELRKALFLLQGSAPKGPPARRSSRRRSSPCSST
jgi:hypothetical protein